LVNTVPRRTSRNTLKNKANTLYHNRPHTVSKSLRERHPRRLNGLCSQTMLTGGSSGTSCRGWQLGWLSRARARPLKNRAASRPPHQLVNQFRLLRLQRDCFANVFSVGSADAPPPVQPSVGVSQMHRLPCNLVTYIASFPTRLHFPVS
jgi:hypothetical protein